MEVKNFPENNEREGNGFRRSIKTFMIRAGHFTNAEKNAYNNLLPVWGIPLSDKKTDFEKIFGNDAPLTVEIGFGMGKATALIAEANPDKNYIGIEVHKPGIGKLLGEIESRNLKNLRIIEGDALDALENMFEDESVDAFHIFFPDPWQKKRHFKRRLVQRPRTDLLSKKLKGGGYIYFVTDWLPYAEFALSELEATPGIKNKFERFAPHQEWRPETRFEQKGTEANRVITEILFGKI